MGRVDLPQLHFIIDTNIILQCKPLAQLDWSKWCDFEEIHLIVSKPVLRELDEHKYSQKRRISKRARKFLSEIRPLVNSPDEFLLISENALPVKLFIATDYRPSDSLKEELDYSRTDDEVIGIAKSYLEENTTVETRLLTHDIGPMITARNCKIQLDEIPDDWLLPPENDEISRENRRLKQEIEDLKAHEPKFEVTFEDQSGRVETLEFKHHVYRDLKDSDIDELIGTIKDKFPAQSNFDLNDNYSKQIPPILTPSILISTPPNKKEIDAYLKKEYPDWIKKCESIFRNIPELLNDQLPPIEFSFVVKNTGFSPAKSVLIRVISRGDFQIQPVKLGTDNDELESTKMENNLLLPLPPKPPKNRINSIINQIPTLPNIGAQLEPMRLINPRIIPISRIHRDSDELIYKENYFENPVTEFGLECGQWRHKIDGRSILGRLCLDSTDRKYEGVLEIQLHAENLTMPLIKCIKVLGKTVFRDSASVGRALIEDLNRRL